MAGILCCVLIASQVCAASNTVTVIPHHPFGTCFLEGEAAAVEWSVSWPGTERRRIEIAGRLTDDRGSAHGELQAAADLALGEKITLPLSGGSADALGPGLYLFDGALSCAQTSLPVRVRFGILNRELNAVPNEDIPAWMGMGNGLTRMKDRDLVREVFAFMNTLGVRAIRTPIIWVAVSDHDGQFDWSNIDLHVDLAGQYGMQTVALLGWWGHHWPEHMQAIRERGERPLYTPEGRQYWADAYLVPVLERYGDRVNMVEILNEPNAFWNEEDPMDVTGFAQQIGSPVYYADLVLRCWNAARRIDPSIRVMAALASTGWREDIPRLLELGVGETLPTGLTLHNYGDYFERRMAGVNAILAAEGYPPPPLAITEIGHPIASDDARQAGGLANTLAETYLSTPSLPNEMLTVNWYTLTGMPPREERYEFGILDGLQADQPAVAYHTVARLLAGAGRGMSETRGKLRIHRVRRRDRPPLVAVRGTTRRPVPVELMRTGGEPVRAWDLMGRAVNLNWQDNAAHFEVSESFILIEGDVRVVPRTQLVLEPGPERHVRVRARTVREATAAATLRVAVEGRDAPAREHAVLLVPGETIYDVHVGAATTNAAVRVRASLTWVDGCVEQTATVTLTPAPDLDATEGALRPPAAPPPPPPVMEAMWREAWMARGPQWAGDLKSWHGFLGNTNARPCAFIENWGGGGASLSAAWAPVDEGGLEFETEYGWKWGGAVRLEFGAPETEWRFALDVSPQPGERKYRASWVREDAIWEAPPIRAPDVKDLGSHAGGGDANGFAARLTLRFEADPARVLLYRDEEELADLTPPTRFVPHWFTATDYGEYWRVFSLKVRAAAESPAYPGSPANPLRARARL
jgi:hypothetical protein